MLNSQVLGDIAIVPAPAQSAPVLPNYTIEVVRDPKAGRARLDAAHREGLATPFQGPDWISAWYATLGSEQAIEPLLVFVTERDTGQAVLTLPLIRHRVDGLDVIAFADLGVTDYNAPILGHGAPTQPKAARTLWERIVEALPPADLIQLRKMPVSVRGRANPLALLHGVHPSHSPGFSVSMPEDWDAYLHALTKKFRKELGRSFRIFEKEGDAAFRRIETVDEAMRALAVMNEQQRARLEEMGYTYAIDEDDYEAFYAGVVAEGLANGTTILTALICDGVIVAALLGVTDGTSLVMVRLSHASGDWMKIGLGRLVIERTMHALHQRGIRHFDFSIGDYPYKSGFGVEPGPLLDFVAARSWRGQKCAARDLAKAAVKRALGMIGVSLVPKAVKNRYRRYHGSNG
jgi:CelD/BcsL family acetyltransferase involved in cellulose biosynthesis